MQFTIIAKSPLLVKGFHKKIQKNSNISFSASRKRQKNAFFLKNFSSFFEKGLAIGEKMCYNVQMYGQRDSAPSQVLSQKTASNILQGGE